MNYEFILDGGDALPDPCSRWQPDGLRGSSRVLDARALPARERRGQRRQEQGAGHQAHVATSWFGRPHQRYPASPMACMQRALTPPVVVRHGIDLLVSLVEPAHNLTISRAHALATAPRAATRFAIPSKTRR